MPVNQNLEPNAIFPKLWIAGGASVVALAVCAVIALRPQPGTAPRFEPFSAPSASPPRAQQMARARTAAFADAPPPSPAVQPQLSMPAEAKMRAPGTAPERGPTAAEAPLIARTVSLTVTVRDLAATRSTLDAMLARTHGYTAQLSAGSPEDGARTLSASLRVPAPALDAALSELKKLGRTTNESQGGEEVTSQHEDLVARLKTARETEERYRAILLQRTGKVSDVLEVEEQISSVRGDIERMEAEQQGLERRVAFASVDVQFTEEYKARLEAPSNSVGTQMSNALVAGLRHVGASVLGIVLFAEEYGPAFVLWAFLLAAPALLVWKRRRRASTPATT